MLGTVDQSTSTTFSESSWFPEQMMMSGLPPRNKKWYTPHNFAGVPALMRGYGYEQTSNIDDAGLLVLTGGSDISPRLYGQEYHRTTHDWLERDDAEVKAFHKAAKKGLPIFGICRGAQMICALNGGTLWQNVSGHGRDHMCYDSDGSEMFVVSSLHHQMCRPDPSNTKILGFAKGISRVFEDDRKLINGEQPFGSEPELMYHHNINALAVQGHPEFMTQKDAFVKWCGAFIKESM